MMIHYCRALYVVNVGTDQDEYKYNSIFLL